MNEELVNYKGYCKLLEIKKVPVYVHWTFPIGGLVISAFSDFKISTILSYCVSYTLLVVIHELGHVLAAVATGTKVSSVAIVGWGGFCYLDQIKKIGPAFIIFSSGLVAQVLVFLCSIWYLYNFDEPETVFGNCLLKTFTRINFIVFVANLLPYNEGKWPTDGKVLFDLLVALWKHRKLRVRFASGKSPIFSSEKSLVSMKKFVPKEFTVGVEIFNDNTTPMDFVVDILTKALNLTEDEAVNAMIEIHTNGGKLFSMPSEAVAIAAVEKINAAVVANQHQLICRLARLDASPRFTQ